MLKKKLKRTLKVTAQKKSKGYVYFISDGLNIKIGITINNPSIRLKQLQTSNPNRLKLIHYIEAEDFKLIERRLHHLFKIYKTRYKGEWFNLPKEAIAWIKTWRTEKDIQV